MTFYLQIVDDDSTTIGHPDEVRQWLPANHLDMCRCESRDSVAYKRVAGAIVELIDDMLDRLPDSEMSKSTKSAPHGEQWILFAHL